MRRATSVAIATLMTALGRRPVSVLLMEHPNLETFSTPRSIQERGGYALHDFRAGASARHDRQQARHDGDDRHHLRPRGPL